jgi:methyltransferase-like protein
LEELKPDIVLVEGPPEADDILQWAVHKELHPPVAILCYQPDDPQRSVFYPFAEFSPEWQAILFARNNQIPVRFFDLPIAQQFAVEKAKREEGKKEPENLTSPEHLNQPASEAEETFDLKNDPISYLAEAAGYEEGEKWWEQMFEYRHNCEQVFEAVTEAMQSLRESLRLKEDQQEKLREAHMRKMIRQAEKEHYTSIAVICGAWHAPALTSMPKQKEDNDLLKGLPRVKVECTWIPWTYQRLSYYSGYGAGIHSPGWYEHLWHHPKDDGTRWMTRVAQLFRKNGMDTSVAHVIEAVRLAETLASLRGLSKAGLEELNEATLSVLCNGEPVLLQLIQEELIVSHKIGEVPADIPKPPLQVDIEKRQKSLRLPPTADFKDYTLDLRKETDLERSIFLHRLRLLGIKWGSPSQVSGKGTFKEQWRLQWDPAFSIDIIEKGSWGTTVEEAANKYVIHQAQETTSLLSVSNYLAEALPAELHSAVEVLIRQLNNLSAASGDVLQLMEAVPSLVNVARYGNVRKTDSELVLQIVSSLITRVCIGLPNAVTGMDEESAQNLLELVHRLHEAIVLLQQEEMTSPWQQTLKVMAANQSTTPVLSGYATRLLSDFKVLQGEELVKAFHFRMSSANTPDASAAWLEGFLKGSGSLLLVDHDLWTLVNQWVDQLDAASFTQVLPLLRRTFSSFTPPERRKLGEKVKSGGAASGIRMIRETDLDTERAQQGIPIVLQLLGLKTPLNS